MNQFFSQKNIIWQQTNADNGIYVRLKRVQI